MVSPKVIGHYRISYRDVTSSTFIVVSIVAKPPQRSRLMQFSMRTLGLQRLKLGYSDLVHRLCLFTTYNRIYSKPKANAI